MGWVKVKWIPRLFAAFDALWPNRNHAQDGTIGDTAHQSSPSGHNPDDTPGSRPEREDADNIPEVRAADVDARGVNMQAVIDAIVADPNERKRFIYIIFNGYIWSASNNWRKAKYNGDDQHTTHGHFSGDPNYDEDARPFAFAQNYEGDAFMAALTDEQQKDVWVWLAAQMDPATTAAGRADDRFHFPSPFKTLTAIINAQGEALAAARQAAVKAAADVAEVKTTLAEVKTLLDALAPSSGGGTSIDGTYSITKVA